ncbi:hypothetical protein [Zhongshania sp. BJYM1]|uniref:hypothetical protein n=1 Tax=Zhongshania aquatica TaxID=2965069 RepID=UPI0022B552A4|nr:hypothetical protein [Marortus sp. BJYM1]
MLLDVLQSDQEAVKITRRLHISNGGAWAESLSKDQGYECYQLINSLPVSRTVSVGEFKIGIIHAGWRWHWDELVDAISLTSVQEEYATWARLNHSKILSRVEGVDAVVSGHQNTRYLKQRGNQLWIDTIGKTSLLTILDAGQVLGMACVV